MIPAKSQFLREMMVLDSAKEQQIVAEEKAAPLSADAAKRGRQR
jgi:hypothetical protein